MLRFAGKLSQAHKLPRSHNLATINAKEKLLLRNRCGAGGIVDSVLADATIYNPGGPHLGAFPGPLFSALRQASGTKSG